MLSEPPVEMFQIQTLFLGRLYFSLLIECVYQKLFMHSIHIIHDCSYANAAHGLFMTCVIGEVNM